MPEYTASELDDIIAAARQADAERIAALEAVLSALVGTPDNPLWASVDQDDDTICRYCGAWIELGDDHTVDCVVRKARALLGDGR